jgi:hypothetical protein
MNPNDPSDYEQLVGRKYRPWTEIDGEAYKIDGEAYKTVCIWCGITCTSVEALEEHEEMCE